MTTVESLARNLVLGALLEQLRSSYGPYKLLAHWQQGEFHHDLVLRLAEPPGDLPGGVLVVSSNCNGGVKEVLALEDVPDRWALWHSRCPENPEFAGELPRVVAAARTPHWFEPCELLAKNARSELRPEHRRRQRGGGWEPMG